MTTNHPSMVPELLPWADPYIATLHQQHAQDLRREEKAVELSRPSGRARVSPARRPSHGESRRRERMTQSRRLNVLAW